MSLTELLHPLTGNGYQFWSGIGSDFGEIPLLGFVWITYRRHNCHVKGCPRIQWRSHPEDDGHLVCRKHHPKG